MVTSTKTVSGYIVKKIENESSKKLNSVVEGKSCLVMAFVVYVQVTPLTSFVRTTRTLERRRLIATLDGLVPPHGALPSVSLTAESAAEFALLLMRNTGHERVQVRQASSRKQLERLRKHQFRRGPLVFVDVVFVVGTTGGPPTAAVALGLPIELLPQGRKVAGDLEILASAPSRPCTSSIVADLAPLEARS